MIFDTIYYEWNEIKLEQPIAANVQIVNHRYEIENKTLNIKFNTSTYENCEIVFQDLLDLMYEDIVYESDENLTFYGHELKQNFLFYAGTK
jgi:hypothetical protein